MTTRTESRPPGAAGLASVFTRWLLGAFFVYAGSSKALQPVEFLQSLRLYQLGAHAIQLNLVAALVPWLEIFLGLLLMAGVAVRGAALLMIGLLAAFTILVVQRALAVHAADGIPFCAIRFDCGCGTGERFVCGKIAENMILLLLAGVLLGWPVDKWCARYSLMQKKDVRSP